MKNKAQALALELELLELDAAQEEIETELDKNASKRRKGLIIFLLGLFSQASPFFTIGQAPHSP